MTRALDLLVSHFDRRQSLYIFISGSPMTRGEKPPVGEIYTKLIRRRIAPYHLLSDNSRECPGSAVPVFLHHCRGADIAPQRNWEANLGPKGFFRSSAKPDSKVLPGS
jgi:hypothetical protein